jgi:glycerol uptake facilitator-like aquaporin
MAPLSKRLAAEALGTAFLLAAIIGSGIMGERLSGGNVAIALLANSVATGCALGALILVFGPISGAHFNPAVTLAMASRGEMSWRDVVPYICVQLAAAFVGVMTAHMMFNEPLLMSAAHVRTDFPQWWSEFIATFGLLSVIWGCARRHSLPTTALAIAGYITAAYWFTGSTSFANPAVTIGRAFSNTFAGIRPDDVVGFLIAQLLGGAVATLVWWWFSSEMAQRSVNAQRTVKASTDVGR